MGAVALIKSHSNKFAWVLNKKTGKRDSVNPAYAISLWGGSKVVMRLIVYQEISGVRFSSASPSIRRNRN